MNKLIITRVKCASSLTCDKIGKTDITQHDMHTEDVQSNSHDAESIGHDECRRDSKGGDNEAKTWDDNAMHFWSRCIRNLNAHERGSTIQ